MNFRDIFTPNDQPSVTYVARDSIKIETNLKDYLETKNIVVSISGPSKTGKTVLLRKVVDPDNLIPLAGAAIKSDADFWRSVLSWMDAPTQVDSSRSTSDDLSLNAKGGGKLGVPGLVQGKAEMAAGYTSGKRHTETQKVSKDPFAQVVQEIGHSDFIIFIDDFHYIPEKSQTEIARIIKALAENGVKICTASVPHRQEDVVRANSELRGRLASVDIPDWTEDELIEIAEKGFHALRADVDREVYERLASEAFGSPQLMQSMCMNLCRAIDLREPLKVIEHFPIDEAKLQETLKDTSDFANFSSTVQQLHSGPKVHGTERKQFSLNDGKNGDVYRTILLAVASDPPARSFTYEEIMNRVKLVCEGEAPSGSSLTGSLEQMSMIAAASSQTSPILEWESDILTIIDPYFAFYLRSSSKLELLA